MKITQYIRWGWGTEEFPTPELLRKILHDPGNMHGILGMIDMYAFSDEVDATGVRLFSHRLYLYMKSPDEIVIFLDSTDLRGGKVLIGKESGTDFWVEDSYGGSDWKLNTRYFVPTSRAEEVMNAFAEKAGAISGDFPWETYYPFDDDFRDEYFARVASSEKAK